MYVGLDCSNIHNELDTHVRITTATSDDYFVDTTDTLSQAILPSTWHKPQLKAYKKWEIELTSLVTANKIFFNSHGLSICYVQCVLNFLINYYFLSKCTTYSRCV